MAGFSFTQFIKKIYLIFPRHYASIFIFILFLVSSSFFFYHAIRQAPLVSADEIAEIEAMRDIMPSVKIFTYDSYYTPWLYGFSGHKIIAPGWGDLKWNLKKWEIFWEAGLEEKKKMLSEFGQPILVYAQDNFLTTDESTGLERIRGKFYLFQN